MNKVIVVVAQICLMDESTDKDLLFFASEQSLVFSYTSR